MGCAYEDDVGTLLSEAGLSFAVSQSDCPEPICSVRVLVIRFVHDLPPRGGEKERVVEGTGDAAMRPRVEVFNIAEINRLNKRD